MEKAIYQIKNLNHTIMRYCSKQCNIKENLPTPAQMQILHFIGSKKEKVYQRDIAKALGLRRATLSEILKTMDCGISHNPISNLRLGCKIADTTKYLQNGLNVALGTDGQGSGNNLDMFETMKIAGLIQGGIHENEERISAKDVIKMATINGAKLLGLDDKIGSVEVGKEADIILVNVEEKLDNIKLLPNNDIISNLVYNTNGNSVDTTIVNGNVLMENRKILTLDAQNIINKFKNTNKAR